MRSIFGFIEFASIILTEPKTLIVAAHRISLKESYTTVCSLLAALSLATSIFYVRSHYSFSYLIFIPVATAVIFLFQRLFSRLLSAKIVQNLVEAPLTQSSKGIADVAQISSALDALFESAFLPGLFVLPICITAKQFSHPSFLILPGLIALSLWMLYIQFAAVQYILEADRRTTITALARNHTMIILFPLLAFYVASILLMIIVNVR